MLAPVCSLLSMLACVLCHSLNFVYFLYLLGFPTRVFLDMKTRMMQTFYCLGNLGFGPSETRGFSGLKNGAVSCPLNCGIVVISAPFVSHSAASVFIDIYRTQQLFLDGIVGIVSLCNASFVYFPVRLNVFL